jgi:hypothetical protein
MHYQEAFCHSDAQLDFANHHWPVYFEELLLHSRVVELVASRRFFRCPELILRFFRYPEVIVARGWNAMFQMRRVALVVLEA